VCRATVLTHCAQCDVEKTRTELLTRGVIAACVRVLQAPTTPLDVQGSALEVLAKLASEKTETQVQCVREFACVRVGLC
jgi:hypothetical protein